MKKKTIFDKIVFNKEGLIPAIIQDEESGEVLMLAYMNKESLEKTLESGRTCFYSRSRKKLWYKGETSDHIQLWKKILLDCDNDTLLIVAKQVGVACHTGHRSCFFKKIEENEIKNIDDDINVKKEQSNNSESADSDIINEIYRIVQDRKINFQKDSYTCKLLANSKDLLPKKIGEEAAEVIIAMKDKEKDALIYEVADLWFHILVVLGYFNISPNSIFKELKRRRKHNHAKSEEKRC